MEVSVIIKSILDVQEITSKKDGTIFKKYGFVGTTQEQYPKDIFFTCIGDEKWNNMGIVVGGTYQVSFDLSSREWNGRWFTECVAWRVTSISQAQPDTQTQVKPTPIPQAQIYQAHNNNANNNNNGGDLPF